MEAAEGVQIMDHDPDGAIHCLQIPTILERLLDYFPSTQLLNLSKVCKAWKYESQTLITKRKNIVVKIETFPACGHAEDFYFFPPIERIKFSGLAVNMDGFIICVGCQDRDRRSQLTAVGREIIERRLPTINSLSFACDGLWRRQMNCPAFWMVQRILEGHCFKLEKFEISLNNQQRQFIQEVLQDRRFDCLKLLKFGMEDAKNSDSTNFIKALVSRAPNLRVLSTSGRVDLSADLLEGSSAIHVTSYPYFASLDIPEVFVRQLRMEKIRFISIPQHFRLENFNVFAERILKASCAFLKVVDVDPMFLLCFEYFGIGLGRVRKLKLRFNSSSFGDDELHDLELLQDFDFNRIFPSLKELQCSSYSRTEKAISEGVITDIVAKWKSTRTEATPARAGNIRRLILYCSRSLTYFNLQLLSRMVPSIEAISVVPHRNEDIPFRFLWNCNFKNLKELQVLRFGHTSKNLDHAFLGMSPSMVDDLRAREDGYLKSLDLKSPYLGISCLRSLNSLKLDCTGLDLLTGRVPQPYLLSKVTGLLAFKKLPDLTVIIRTDDVGRKQALSHMKAYADVILVTDLKDTIMDDIIMVDDNDAIDQGDEVVDDDDEDDDDDDDEGAEMDDGDDGDGVEIGNDDHIEGED